LTSWLFFVTIVKVFCRAHSSVGRAAPTSEVGDGRESIGTIMKHFVYILRSLACDRIYIGSTSNIQRRLSEHNDGRTISTKKFRPWRIIYSELYVTKKEALIREKQLKKWKNRERIEELIVRKMGR
jgi:putative endonuclease